MSTTQNYDFGQNNDDLTKQSSLDNSGEPGDPSGGQPPREGILGAATGAVGNISQVASNAVIIVLIMCVSYQMSLLINCYLSEYS